MSLIEEIREQPEVCARLLDRAAPLVRDVASEARGRDLPFVVIAARGTSDHAAIYAQYAFGVLAGLPVALATPSVVTRYGGRPRMDRALVIGISQSGAGPDIVAVLEEARRQGALTLAITNEVGSPLAAAADRLLHLDAGPERAVAATKTYTTELCAVAMLAAELAPEPDGLRAALAGVPEALRAALGSEGEAEVAASTFAAMDEAVVLGRGFHLATAFEWALKMKELAGVRAQAYSSADYRHGPVASLEERGEVLAVRATGPLAGDVMELIESLRRERDARVLLLSDEVGLGPAAGAVALPYPDSLPEWLAPIPAIVPAQLFCRALTIARGMDPEAPRGLQKVTRTH